MARIDQAAASLPPVPRTLYSRRRLLSLPDAPRSAMPTTRQLRATLETLLSPLEAPDPEAWQDAVCRRLRELSGTDVVFFRLSDRGPSRIDPEVPLPARDVYRSQFRDLDPWPRCRVRAGEARVETHERLVGPRRLPRDLYYNEFMRPYGVCDYVGVQLGITAEIHAHLGVFNSRRSRGAEQAAGTATRLRGVLPALQGGLRAWWAAQGRPGGLAAALDELGDALLLHAAGRGAHANRALVELFSREPEEARLRQGLERVARDLERAWSQGPDALLRGGGEREVRTRLGRYRVRAVTAGERLLPSGGLVLLVEPPPGRAGEGVEPGARFGLTPREAEVARLLAVGHDNAAIAERLGIGATTARNHTARVLRKLGARSRAQVHSLLHPRAG